MAPRSNSLNGIIGKKGGGGGEVRIPKTLVRPLVFKTSDYGINPLFRGGVIVTVGQYAGQSNFSD